MMSAGQRAAGVAVDHDNREKDDFYSTPAEITEALLSVENFAGDIWEPACGDGAISRVLEDAGYRVVSSDLVDRCYGEPRIDFLMEWRPRAPNIITNPPFKLLEPFMQKATALSSCKVALFMRLGCLAGQARAKIYQETPPARVWVFSSRQKVWRNGNAQLSSGGFFDFAWFVWDKSHKGPSNIGWLP